MAALDPPLDLGVGMEQAAKTALRAEIPTLIGKGWHELPGGSEPYSGWLLVSRIRWRSFSLRRWVVALGLPLRRAMP